MLSALLLDAAPAAQGTPVTVYVTIGAAVLAALASLNATRVSSKTAREVATLASKTASESARIAAETAREIKDTDYRYDFYKKIIAKRFGAWEEAEQFIALSNNTQIDGLDNKMFYSFCSNGKELNNMISTMKTMLLNQTMWLGMDYGLIFANLLNFNIDLLRASMSTSDNKYGNVSDAAVLQFGKSHYETHSELINKLLVALHAQVKNMHDVEAFFKEIEGTRIQLGG